MEEFQKEWNAFIDTIVPWMYDHGPRIIFILVGAVALYYLSKRFIVKVVRAAVIGQFQESEEAEIKREDTLIKIFIWSTRLIIVGVATMLFLNELAIPIGPMLAGAGILGIALGFGGQYLIHDFISGFFIILENQYRIGDVVSLDQTTGKVEDISLRMTKLRDLDGVVHHVPHGDVKRVSNASKSFSRINLDIGIAYNADLEKVIEVVNRVGRDLAEDPVWKAMITIPPQFLRVQNFADSSIVLKILGETLPTRQWEVTGELRKRIKIAFDKEGIEIPFPQRVVHHHSLPPEGTPNKE